MCPQGHVEHADVNAGFNIALRPGIVQAVAERDAMEGSSDTPRGATPIQETPEPRGLQRWEYVGLP